MNEEMNKGVLAIKRGTGFQSDTRFSCVASASEIMPQHDHGTVDGFLTWAPRLQAFCLGPCQGLGERREGGQSAHSALGAKVFC